MTTMVPGDGELVAGRYRLVSRVGRGAMGVVWRARDERLDRVVAVKQLLRDDTTDELTASRLSMREGRVAARLRHPHAIMVHDVVEYDGRQYLIMEYFPSQSLASMVAQRGGLAPEVVASVGSQIASALTSAHANGVVHRDLKPGNVLLAADGTAKIADFGISRALGDGTMTDSEIIAGTPAYLAPEVAAGEAAGFSSDVFSLGATLYTALEGGPPFGHDDNPIVLLHRVAHDAIIPPRQSGPVTDLLLWMLRRDRGQRPTMHEVHQAFASIVDGHPAGIPAPETHPINPTLLLPARRPSPRAIGVGVLALCLVAIGIVLGVLLTDGPPAGQAVNTQPDTADPTTTTPADTTACTAEYDVTNSWPGGYQAAVTVRSRNGSALTGWRVGWALPAGHAINNLWNGSLAQDGSSVTVTNASWNAIVAADGTTTFGFTANTAGEPTGGSTPPPTLTCDGR